MELEIVNFKAFYEALNHLYSVGTDLTISVINQTVNLIVIDSIKTVFGRVILKDALFSKKEIPEGFKQLRLELRDIIKVLKSYTKFDTMKIRLVDNEMIFEGRKKGSKKVLKNSLKILALETQEMKMMDGFTAESVLDVPRLQYTVRSSDLKEALSNAVVYDYAIEIKVSENGLVFSSCGSLGGMEYVIENDELELDASAVKKIEPFEVSFSIKHLQNAIIGDKATFRIAREYPISFGYWMNYWDLYYTLAPRVVIDDSND